MEDYFTPGCFYIDSFYRPMQLISIDDEGCIVGKCLVHHLQEGRIGHRDPDLINEWYDLDEHCILCDEEAIQKLISVWENGGEKSAITFVGGLTEEEADEFLRMWRNREILDESTDEYIKNPDK